MFKFFEEYYQNEFCNLVKNEVWCIKLAYLSDIFEYLNTVNQSMQGRAENILTLINNICTMRDKIEIWKRKVKERNFEMFPKLSNCEAKFQITSQIFFFFWKGSTFSNAGSDGTQPASCVDIQNRQYTYSCGCPMYGACQNDVFCGLFCGLFCSVTLAS